MSLISRFFPVDQHGLFDRLLIPLVVTIGFGLGLVIAYLMVKGLWPFAIILLGALPAFVLLHRYPFFALILWLLITPLIVDGNGGMMRRIYWVIHRALPVATVLIILLSSMLGIYKRRLPRPGFPELAMAGYIAITLVSIFYTRPDIETATFQLYDRVVVPMSLYLIVRLTRPGKKELLWLLPVAAFILLTQSAIGLAGWTVPQVLPSFWLDRADERTVGSLDAYSVFSSTIIFCGLFLLHYALSPDSKVRRQLPYWLLFLLTVFMIFMSFSRGSWLAGFVAVSGMVVLYPKSMFRLGRVLIPIFLVLVPAGVAVEQIEQVQYAQQRFLSDNSEKTALSRLPVMVASLRMFESKPLYGWGYGNFDEYDFQFQGRVGDLITPEKDHASHNNYLTLLAEQGLAGFLLYLAPTLWWFAMTIRVFAKMPAEGFWSRKLVLVLWLVLAFHVVVNNFSNMRIVFGLGMWWFTLGLIANTVDSYLNPEDENQTAGAQPTEMITSPPLRIPIKPGQQA